MTVIREVRTKKEKKEFLELPNRLYRDCPCYVPPFYADEKKIFTERRAKDKSAGSVFFLAYEDGKAVGRIQGICHYLSNRKSGEKRVRFTRFDCIDSKETAALLFRRLEDWARSLGMDTVCGPLGYSDLEREGLLIEGFDQLSTYEEQYNYAYYPDLLEAAGYRKEKDWLEFRLSIPEKEDGELERTAEFLLRRYGLTYVRGKNFAKLCEQYYDEFHRVLEDGYGSLYGTVPFTAEMKKELLKTLAAVLDKRFIRLVTDKDGDLVYFALALPSLSKALLHSGGHLSIPVICKLLNAKRHPEVIDLALVSVSEKYRGKGVGGLLVRDLIELMKSENVPYAETNLCLEDNIPILNLWHQFDSVQHKRRRSYVKRIAEGE